VSETSTSSAPISVALVNNFGGPTLGGGEVQLLTLLERLPELGVRPTLVCESGSALEAAASALGSVKVSPMEFASVSIRALAQDIAERVDGVDIVQGTGFLTNVLVRHAGALVGASIVNAVHVVPGAAKLDGESWLRGLVRRTLDRAHREQVARFVAVSDAVGRELARSGILADHIVTIHNGVDIAALEARARGSVDASLPDGSPRVGFVGRLEPVKGCEHFVRAAARLLDDRPDAAFVIAGEGSLRGELEQLVATLRIDGRVAFLGHVPDPAPVIAALDVVVMPSLSEAFGLTALEAMALRVPVVASAVGGLAELVTDGETGLLVQPGDSGAIVEAIERVVDEPDATAAMVAAARALVERDYSAERMAEQYADLYREVLGR